MRRLQKTIFEIGWTRSVVQLPESAPVDKALEVMTGDALDCVLIVRDGKLVGIFTSRDMLNRVAGQKDPHETKLGDVMSTGPRTLRARDPVAFAINWMAIEGYRNVPIVDDEGVPVGVLTAFDVVRALSAILDSITETPRESLQEVSSISKVFDVGGGG